MSYKIQSTEKTTGAAADHETKALLYLLNDHPDSSQIHWVVIDFFNDVTGVNSTCSASWDLQSKSSKAISAKQLGVDSVTLFKNFCSCLEFNNYILFVGGVGARVRMNNKDIFQYSDMQEKSKESFREGLVQEALSSEYIDNEWVKDNSIEEFLSKLIIVICDKSKSDIIKQVAKIKDGRVSDEKLISIFNEIRDKQSVLKNNTVEGVEIERISDFLYHKKYILAEDINNLILNRLINFNTNSRTVPEEFRNVLNRYEYSLRLDITKQCKDAVTRVLFDKNNARNFWQLFASIRNIVINDTSLSLDDIYLKLDPSQIESVPAFDVNSIKFFISLIKESIMYGD